MTDQAEAFRTLLLVLWSIVATMLSATGIFICLDAAHDWLRSRRRGP